MTKKYLVEFYEKLYAGQVARGMITQEKMDSAMAMTQKQTREDLLNEYLTEFGSY